MAYSLEYSKQFIKFLQTRDKKLQIQIIESFEIIAQNPYDNNLDIVKMKGTSDKHYRLRISKYRFLYEILDDKLLVFAYKANSRGDIY